MAAEMTKGQKRLAAIVLALMGILGTLQALEDRVNMNEQNAAQTETVVETTSTPNLDRTV